MCRIHKLIIYFSLLPVLILTSYQSCLADTLVYLADIRFHSDFEVEAIHKFRNGQVDYLSLFLATSSDLSKAENEKLPKQFNYFKTTLSTYINPSIKPEKQIKAIYKKVHADIFKKYENNTSFVAIFQEGIYNCVTATAFYGMLFNKFNIPYLIKESPTHVYMVVYPNEKDIKLESTDPVSGYYLPDNKAKEGYIEYLRQSKLISEDEYLNKSIDELFVKNFYSEHTINLSELIGIQYFNNAQLLLQENSYKEAFYQLEKAYFFYPSERISYTLSMILMNILESSFFKNKEDFQFLLRLPRYSQFGIETSHIAVLFNRFTSSILIGKGQKDYYDSCYTSLCNVISDSSTHTELSFIYHHETGRYLYFKGKSTEAYKQFFKAYQLKPENTEVQSTFVHALALAVNNMEVEQIVDIIDEYYISNPILRGNDIFYQLLLQVYLATATHAYMENKVNRGDTYLNKFENAYISNSDIDIYKDLIGEAYSSAAVYYFKRGYYNKAKNYIHRGLKYAPDNFQLKQSLTSF